MLNVNSTTDEPGALKRRPRLAQFLARSPVAEKLSVLLFSSYAFLVLVSYYILKTLREPLLLATGSAELKSYAYASVALVLLFLIPLYGIVFRHTERHQLVRWVTVFFLATLGIFYTMGRTGLDIGFVYYVWVGVFGVMISAQFWAHAADAHSVASGQRVFPRIMIGAALGGLVGPLLVRYLLPTLQPWSLMLIAMLLLALTLPLVSWTRNSVPQSSRNADAATDTIAGKADILGGFMLVLRDRYLFLLALMVVLLNCINSIGEYILTDLVVGYADDLVAHQPGMERDHVIAAFYGDFYFAVNGLSLVMQLTLVGRLFQWVGVRGAVLLLPIITVIGYGLIVLVPIFSIIRVVKILENSSDYSIMNTVRQALYLPLSPAAKYQGKTTIDTFFWRFGDLLQAGVIFAGLHWLDAGFQQFAILNVLLALVWLGLALQIGKRYAAHAPHPTRESWGRMVMGTSAAALALFVLVVPTKAAAEQAGIFAGHEPLAMELITDRRALCRTPQRRVCADPAAKLVYAAPTGEQRQVEARITVRGRWRPTTGNCRFPALFVFFTGPTQGTPFEDHDMLPLTTHCQHRGRSYEQYVLKEYLAYRIYNLLTDKSLKVRLVRFTYRDTGRGKPIERFGFFTEHFKSLAARHDAEVWKPEYFDPTQANPMEQATLDLFQYMIGNTDWSAIHGHNIMYIQDRAGRGTAVPYDFDFSGLVNAEYAGPPPKLPIRSVRQRLFRGFCHSDLDWEDLFQRFTTRERAVRELLRELAAVYPFRSKTTANYVTEFFDTLNSPRQRRQAILRSCRTPPTR